MNKGPSTSRRIGKGTKENTIAYTKTPTGDTYQTKQIPFVYKWDSREPFESAPGNLPYDAISSNVVFEPVSSQTTGEKIYNAYKRDGTTHLTWALATPPNPVHHDFSENVEGIWYNSASGYTIVLTINAGGTLTSYYVLGGLATGQPVDIAAQHLGALVQVFDNPINWTDYVYDSGEIAVFLSTPNHTGVEKIKLSGGFANSAITPAIGVHNGDPTTLDGYLFLSTPNGNIYNSNLNDPATWGASNFITAESFGDGLKRIARSGPYIVAFGTDSIEWFYDAANPTGSPLSVYTGATKRVGLLGGVAAVGDTLYFVGKTPQAAASLYKIEGLKLEQVADFTMSRQFGTNYRDSFEQATGNFVSYNGHTVYVWWSATDDAFPICYDLDTKMFVSLDFKQGDLDIIQSTSIPFEAGYYSSAFCRTADSRVYYFDPSVYQDDLVDFTAYLQTKNEDFGTRRLKFGSRALLNCDQTDASSNCQLSWTVDDYKTWSTTRTVDLESVYPASHALGQFRKIAFKLTYTDNFPMRFNAIELDYNLGGA